ncbi:MAG: AAA family ATPase [Ancrocorticia sp.]|nr:AAA family ATPase [Ancrocorticia sp.]
MLIKNISVTAEYCFGKEPLTLGNLGKVNFVFAPNGSGKTTISNTLMKQPLDRTARRNWSVAPTDLRIRVFNEAYKNSVLVEHIDGIFTMGDAADKANAEIAQLESENRDRADKREELRRQIGSALNDGRDTGVKGEIASFRAESRDQIHEIYKRLPQDAVKIVFAGFRNSKENLFGEALRRFENAEPAPGGMSWDKLEKQAKTIRSDKPLRPKIPSVSITNLLTPDEATTISDSVMLRGYGSFGALIQHLGNADWVNQGRSYLGQTHGHCPFCQQENPADLEVRLHEFFAGGYDAELQRVRAIYDAVAHKASVLENELVAVESALELDQEIDSRFFSAAIDSLRNAASLVISRVQEKLSHPTLAVEVTDIGNSADALIAMVARENEKIEQWDRMLSDVKRSRADLIENGWKLFLSDRAVSQTITMFNGRTSTAEKKINRLEKQITESLDASKTAENRIAVLRSSVSNTAAVADRINDLLRAMGFYRFQLRVEDSIVGGYRIVRNDGSSAHDSLSEGEKSFICFAYFWESLRGSPSPGKVPEDVVVVIDDPISSLDSDSLFIVAAHVREAAQSVIKNQSNIRQIIVLTHNTQFHHEAAYCNQQYKESNRHYYRLVRGSDGFTVVKDDGRNSQIRGSYEMLWDAVVEAARNENDSSVLQAGVFNIVRRIIEGYFKYTGARTGQRNANNMSITDRKIMAMFRVWANSESHTIVDDVAHVSGLDSTKKFLQLLQRYFEVEGQSAHFEMMIENSGGADLLQPGGIFARENSEVARSISQAQ